jgi:hypothetical protein
VKVRDEVKIDGVHAVRSIESEKGNVRAGPLEFDDCHIRSPNFRLVEGMTAGPHTGMQPEA